MKKILLITFLFSTLLAMTSSFGDVVIDISNSKPRIVGDNVILINNITVRGLGQYWAKFKWDPKSLNFYVTEYGIEDNNNNEHISCERLNSGTNPCRGADRYPTSCKGTVDKFESIQQGMSYGDVYNIMGCHGVIKSHKLDSNLVGSSIAVEAIEYCWGEPHQYASLDSYFETVLDETKPYMCVNLLGNGIDEMTVMGVHIYTENREHLYVKPVYPQ